MSRKYGVSADTYEKYRAFSSEAISLQQGIQKIRCSPAAENVAEVATRCTSILVNQVKMIESLGFDADELAHLYGELRDFDKLYEKIYLKVQEK